MVNRLLGHAGAPGDLVERGAVATLGKHVCCRFEDFSSGVVAHVLGFGLD